MPYILNKLKKIKITMCANRRTFIKTSTAVATGIALAPSLLFSNNPMNIIKIGIIGVGLRGRDHLDLALRRDDVEVSAICDIDPMALQTSQKVIKDYDKPKAKEFTGSDESYKSLLEEDLDAVIIATPWLWHTPMAIDSMRSGKYVGVEVPNCLDLGRLFSSRSSFRGNGNAMHATRKCLLPKRCYGHIKHGSTKYVW